MGKDTKKFEILVKEYKKLKGYDDGGTVKPDPDKLQSAQDSLRKAFHFADGAAPVDPLVEQYKKLYPGVSDDQINTMIESGKKAQAAKALADQNRPNIQPISQQQLVPQAIQGQGDLGQVIGQQAGIREAAQRLYYGGKVKGYSEGGHTLANTASGYSDPMDAMEAQITHDRDKPKSLADKIADFFGHQRVESQDIQHKFNGGQIRKYADGAAPIEPDLSGSTEEQVVDDSQDPMIQKYRAMGLLKGPTTQTSEQANISASPSEDEESSLAKPASLMDVEDKSPDDKELEEKMANEDFEAGEKSDEKKKEEPKDESDDSEEESDEREPAAEDKKLDDQLEEEPKKEEESSSMSRLMAALKPGSASQDLANAQRDRDRNIAYQQIEKGAAIAGGGLSKTDPSQTLKAIGDRDQYVGLPVQKYGEQVANQKFDANSVMSQTTRDYLKQKYNMKIPDNASYADIEKVAGYALKDEQLQNALKKVTMQQKGAMDRTTLQQSESNLRSSRRDQALKDAAAIRAETTAAGQKKTDDRSSKKAVLQIVQRINNDPVIKPSRQNKASLDKALMIMSNKNVPLTPQFLSDAEQDISSALQLRGQGATEGKIKRTELITLGRQIAEAKQHWLNKPDVDLRKTDPKLVNTIFKAAQAVRDDYTTTIQKGQKEIAEEYESALGDDPIINKAIQKFKGTTDSAAGLHQPGDVVTVKGKQYRVGADGDSLEEVK